MKQTNVVKLYDWIRANGRKVDCPYKREHMNTIIQFHNAHARIRDQKKKVSNE